MSDVLEITTEQARAADALRRRWPNGRVLSHERPWGVILEVRVGDRAVDFVALTTDGRVDTGADLRCAA
jgi:hypothetical protein